MKPTREKKTENETKRFEKEEKQVKYEKIQYDGVRISYTVKSS